jgi:hypothetical protein
LLPSFARIREGSTARGRAALVDRVDRPAERLVVEHAAVDEVRAVGVVATQRVEAEAAPPERVKGLSGRLLDVGHLLCFVDHSGQVASIVWTDDRLDIMSFAWRDDFKLSPLFEAWQKGVGPSE